MTISPGMRRGFAATGGGSVWGLLVGGYWEAAHRAFGTCDATPCMLPVSLVGWGIGILVLPLAAFVVLAIFGYRRHVVSGILVFGLGVFTYEAFVYGTPRPPIVALAVLGSGSFLLADALAAAGRIRLAAGGMVGVLAITLLVGELTSGQRDARHRFTELAALNRLPDPARWHVDSADAYPRYQVVELTVRPIGGGPEIMLEELPLPADWQPPLHCGPLAVHVAFILATNTTSANTDGRFNSCTSYPGGGWQRRNASGGIDIIDVQDGVLLLTAERDSAQPAAGAADQRDLLNGLRRGTPGQMVRRSR